MAISISDVPDGEWPSSPIDISDSEFEEAITRWPNVVVDFWAPWCGPCRAIAPALESIAEERTGEIAILKVNTDLNQALAGQHGVMSIPTLLYIKNGKVTDKAMGAEPPARLNERINKMLA